MKRIKLPILEITYREHFLLKSLYMSIHEWLQENSYVDVVGSRLHNFLEILYMERHIPNKDMRIWWRAYKTIERNTYYRYKINILFRILNMVDKEMMVNGKKLKVQYGEVTMMFFPFVEMDFEDKWAKHPLLSHFDSIFRRRIFYRELNTHKKELYRDVYRLHGMIKKFLELKSFMPDLESFHEKFDKM